MNNEHTPGFYIIEEYRCARAFETMRHIAKCKPDTCKDHLNSLYDCINAMENIDTHHTKKIDKIIDLAYNKLQQKNNFIHKILQKLK